MASSSLIARLLIRTSNFLSPRSSQTLSPLLRNNDNTTNRYTIFLRQRQQQQQQHASKSYSGGAGKGDSGDDQRRYGSPLRKAGFVRKMVDEGKKETRGSVAFRDVNGKNKDVFQAFDGEGQGEDEEAEEEDDEAEWEDQHQHSHLAENNQGRSEPIDPSAFGEQLALAGLTEKDLDSLIAKMDFSGIQGLPPLEEILQHDPEGEQKAKRQEMEMRKQQELAMTRVKTVDELGRAYATGRRKTSEACGWLSEGKGRIIINGKTHDIYFPSLDHHVQLLEPFCEAQTLGKFKVFSTVKGGGITEAATMQNLVGLGVSLPVASLLSSPKFASQLQHRRTFIQLKTNLEVADNSGARRVQCIKVLGGGKGARLGDTIIASVKDAAPRGKVKKGEVVYCVVVRAAMQKLRCDGSQIKFDGNAVVLVNKQLEPIGTRVFGPISAELRQRKLDKVLALAEQIA